MWDGRVFSFRLGLSRIHADEVESVAPTRWFGAASPQRVGDNAFHLSVLAAGSLKSRVVCMVTA